MIGIDFSVIFGNFCNLAGKFSEILRYGWGMFCALGKCENIVSNMKTLHTAQMPEHPFDLTKIQF